MGPRSGLESHKYHIFYRLRFFHEVIMNGVIRFKEPPERIIFGASFKIELSVQMLTKCGQQMDEE